MVPCLSLEGVCSVPWLCAHAILAVRARQLDGTEILVIVRPRKRGRDRERARERERDKNRERERERARESVYVCVCEIDRSSGHD